MNFQTVAFNLSKIIPMVDLSQVPEDAGEKLMYGLKITFIGMVTVFVVLLALMFIIQLFGFIFYTLPNRKKDEAGASESAVQVPVQAPITTAPVAEEDDAETAAIIAAAIAVYCEQNGIQSKYRIKSFKRVN